MIPGIENTISIGNIITILSVVCSVVWLVASLKNDINLVKTDVHYLQKSNEALTEAFKQLGKVLTSVALQDQRITMLEKHIDELSHGKGFVK